MLLVHFFLLTEKNSIVKDIKNLFGTGTCHAEQSEASRNVSRRISCQVPVRDPSHSFRMTRRTFRMDKREKRPILKVP